MTEQVFTASTVRDALRSVKETLGDEAIIVSQQRLGDRVQVVATIQSELVAAMSMETSGAPEASSPPAQPSAVQTTSVTASEPALSFAQQSRLGLDPGLSAIHTVLMRLGFDAATLARFGDLLRWDDFRHRIGAVFRFMPEQGAPSGAYRFVGGPGAGKSSLLIKVLAQHVIAARSESAKSVRVIAMDDSKVAGNEGVATACELLGVPFEVVRDPAELCARMDGADQDASRSPASASGSSSSAYGSSSSAYGSSSRAYGSSSSALTLIDTSGSHPPAPVPGVRDVLVMPATWQACVLNNQLLDSLQLPLAGVAITHVDRAPAVGVALSIAASRDLPLAWFGMGSDIPNAIENADPLMLFQLVVRGIDQSEISTTFTL